MEVALFTRPGQDHPNVQIVVDYGRDNTRLLTKVVHFSQEEGQLKLGAQTRLQLAMGDF